MPAKFKKSSVSIVFAITDKLPYAESALCDSIESALKQDQPGVKVILVDNRGPDRKLELNLSDASRVTYIADQFKNRAAMYNAALKACDTDFFLAVYNEAQCVTLTKSAVQTMVMAATRMHPMDLVYSDYDRVESDGKRHEIKLADWHPGRVRDGEDMGLAILYRTAAMRECGGYDESFNAADIYDLRLKISESKRVAHIGNRYAGSLYTVAAPPQAHNVFDYLMEDKSSQLEMEHALSGHLKRIGAYLEPGAHVGPVYANGEKPEHAKDCIASVVIPVNNRPEFIGRAIESVQAQTEQRVETVIVVNGGDTDPTIPAVKEYMKGGAKYDASKPPVQLIVVDINNLGLCLNTGIASANGMYYVQLDSDDRLKPDAVEKILAVFDSDPAIGMVVGSYEVSVLDEKTGKVTRDENVPVVTHAEWTADNGRNNLLRIGGAGAPRAAHIKVIADAGWFGVNDDNECRNYGEDYDLVNRIAERYVIGRVWDPIYEVIRHSGGTDHNIDPVTIARNNNAKDHTRLEAIHRRQQLNQSK